MSIFEVFIQARDLRKALEESNAFTTGRMGHTAAEFFKLLAVIKEFLLTPSNIKGGLLIFLARKENLDSLGPLIDLIQPMEDRKVVRYHIAAALVMEVDRMAAKKNKYGQLGLNDSDAFDSFRRLEQYLEENSHNN
jgi:hypothetical protein